MRASLISCHVTEDSMQVMEGVIRRTFQAGGTEYKKAKRKLQAWKVLVRSQVKDEAEDSYNPSRVLQAQSQLPVGNRLQGGPQEVG